VTSEVRVAIVYAAADGGRDAIASYADRLTTELDARTSVSAFRASVHELSDIGARADVVLLQYNPFSYGSRGFAPDLLAQWRRARGVSLRAIMIHEPYVPMTDWRAAMMGTWQRLQLAALLSSVDLVFMAIEGWRTCLWKGRGRAVHLPVPSLLPDARTTRGERRASLGIADDQLVVVTLGTGHPSQLTSYHERAVKRLIRDGYEPVVLALGDGAPVPEVGSGARVLVPGPLPGPDLASHLAAGDLFLAALIDGVSTRRTAVMAALQHELAVTGTNGPLTDDVFRTCDGIAWRLAPAGDEHAFAATASSSAPAAVHRGLGLRGRAVYEERFDWSPTVDVLLRGLLR
jgi:glycosyltransferase involved in cell wall biosynthesis